MTHRLKKIYVAGASGLLGREIVKVLEQKYGDKVLVYQRTTKSKTVRDHFNAVRDMMQHIAHYRFDEIYLCAANVAGIQYNKDHPATMLYDNLAIQTNLIETAFVSGCKKLMFFGSSCIYPKNIPNPCELDLLTGPLEDTNRAYALAKIAGLEMCASYRKEFDFDARAILPCNMYGNHDRFGGDKSHVLGDLLARFHKAKQEKLPEVVVWGDGTPLREFINSKDVALAAVHVMGMSNDDYLSYTKPEARYLNCGYGEDITIADLAIKIKELVGYEGNIWYDTTKPNGTHRKLLDSSALRATGWDPTITLNEGLIEVYDHYKGKIA